MNESVKELLHLVHTDVCGPIDTSTIGRYLYFIIFIDDFSRYDYMFLMRHKSEFLERFKAFQNKSRINLGRRSRHYDRIVVANI
jgi:hypothetical protein